MPAFSPLHVLIIEDNPDDAELMIRSIEEWSKRNEIWSSVVSQVATSEEEFRKALQSDETFDVIIADYTLPQFSAPMAYDLLQAENNRTPFLVVTGGQDDEACVALMNRGAADYLFKDRLQRLGLAVEKAVEHHRILVRTELGLKISDEISARLEEIIRGSEEIVREITEHKQRGWKTRG